MTQPQRDIAILLPIINGGRGGVCDILQPQEFFYLVLFLGMYISQYVAKIILLSPYR